MTRSAAQFIVALIAYKNTNAKSMVFPRESIQCMKAAAVTLGCGKPDSLVSGHWGFVFSYLQAAVSDDSGVSLMQESLCPILLSLLRTEKKTGEKNYKHKVNIIQSLANGIGAQWARPGSHR
jgi:hypothetical protein